MSRVKIIIEDGIIEAVLSNDETIEIEIVDFDSEKGDSDELEKEYDNPDLNDANYCLSQCEEDTENDEDDE